MMSSRVPIVLYINSPEEVSPGVFEPVYTPLKIKAEQEQISQRRRDLASYEGRVITARFRVKSYLITGAVDKVLWGGSTYKVNQVLENVEDHDSIIEIGELV